MNRHSCFSVATGLMLLVTVQATAEVTINGYFSQAVVHSPDNPFFEADEKTSWNFRELGVNGSWQINPQLRLAAQVVSRRLGDIDDGSPKLDFGLLDYQFYNSESLTAGLRLGRTKNAYGIYNQTRDVPHARPGVLVPQSIYFESMRDALLSVDGGNVYMNGHTSVGDVTFEAYLGTRNLEESVVENLMFQADTSGDFGTADVAGARLGFSPAVLPDLDLALSVIDVSMDLENVDSFTPQQIGLAYAELLSNPAAAGKYATSATIEPFVQLLSAQYSWLSWVFTAEYLQVDIDLTDLSILDVPQPDNFTTLESYYAQVEWQASESLSLFSRYEYLVYDKDDRKGEAYAQRTGRNPVAYYSSGVTLGARWYFQPDFSITGEIGSFVGAASLIGPNSIDYAELVEDWDLFVVQLSYHF